MSILKTPKASSPEMVRELEKCTQLLRNLDFNVETGVHTKSRLPVIFAPNTETMSLYTPVHYILHPTAYLVALPLKPRMQTMLSDPPVLGEITPHQMVALESVANDWRIKACIEPDRAECVQLFSHAIEAYECALASWGSGTVMHMLKQRAKMETKRILFSPVQGNLHPLLRQRISHCFAGMALSYLFQRQRPITLFFGLASSAIAHSPDDLKLAAFLRVQLLMFAAHTLGLSTLARTGTRRESGQCFTIKPGELDFDVLGWFDDLEEGHRFFTVYDAFNEQLLFPIISRLRPELIDAERALLLDVDKAEVLAKSINQRADDLAAGKIPPTQRGRRMPMVDGRIIERMCGGCGAWEEARKFARCAGCKRVFYCGRACQQKDWRRHKPECKGC